MITHSRRGFHAEVLVHWLDSMPVSASRKAFSVELPKPPEGRQSIGVPY